MRKNNKKGFTLAELLIVVAIIAVLVAIAIPVFTTQLEKSREATDLSNVRSAYAEIMADYLANGAKSAYSTTVTAMQTQSGWQMGSSNAVLHTRVDGTEGTVSITNHFGGSTFTVAITASGTVSVD